MGFIFIPLWSGKDNVWKEMAWIGPVNNLKPEPRRSVSIYDKRMIMSSQKNSCNFCERKISLGEFNCDLDHIVPINISGKTTIENLQFLCVSCHRKKTSLENRGDLKLVNLKTPPNEKEILIFYESNNPVYPLNSITPATINNYTGKDLCILSYSKRKVGIDQSINIDNIFDKFKYIPTVDPI